MSQGNFFSREKEGGKLGKGDGEPREEIAQNALPMSSFPWKKRGRETRKRRRGARREKWHRTLFGK